MKNWENLNELEILSLINSNIQNLNERNDDINGQTLLHITVSKKIMVGVKHLINLNAKTSIQNKINKKTPLHIAVEENNYSIIKLLIKSKDIFQTIFIKDKNGYTPLMIAKNKGYEKIDELLKPYNLLNFQNIQLKKIIEDRKLFSFLKYTFYDGWEKINNNLKAKQKKIEFLDKLNKKLENKKEKKWLNIISFGWYKWKINRQIDNNKITILEYKTEIENLILKNIEVNEEIKEMIDKNEVNKQLKIDNQKQQTIIETNKDKIEKLEHYIKEIISEINKLEKKGKNLRVQEEKPLPLKQKSELVPSTSKEIKNLIDKELKLGDSGVESDFTTIDLNDIDIEQSSIKNQPIIKAPII